MNLTQTQAALENHAWTLRYRSAISARGEKPIEQGGLSYDDYEDALADQYLAGRRVFYPLFPETGVRRRLMARVSPSPELASEHVENLERIFARLTPTGWIVPQWIADMPEYQFLVAARGSDSLTS